jgi:hypothetical protein
MFRPTRLKLLWELPRRYQCGGIAVSDDGTDNLSGREDRRREGRGRRATPSVIRSWVSNCLPTRNVQSIHISWSKTSARHEPGLCFSDIGNNTRDRPQWKWLRHTYLVACNLQWKARIGQLAAKRNRQNRGIKRVKWDKTLVAVLRCAQVPIARGWTPAYAPAGPVSRRPAPQLVADGCCNLRPATSHTRRYRG